LAATFKKKIGEFFSSNGGSVTEDEGVEGLQNLVRGFNDFTKSCETVGVLDGFKTVDAAAQAIEYFGAKK
jgi:hypothetical protein